MDEYRQVRKQDVAANRPPPRGVHQRTAVDDWGKPIMSLRPLGDDADGHANYFKERDKRGGLGRVISRGRVVGRVGSGG